MSTIELCHYSYTIIRDFLKRQHWEKSESGNGDVESSVKRA